MAMENAHFYWLSAIRVVHGNTLHPGLYSVVPQPGSGTHQMKNHHHQIVNDVADAAFHQMVADGVLVMIARP
jgi:hypothetical protein